MTPLTRRRSLVRSRSEGICALDILVSNAAYQMLLQSLDEIDDAEWDKTFRTNIYRMLYLSKAAMKHMKPGSAIVNTTSINAKNPNPTLLPDATTKGAIANFTASLAQLLAKQGIRGQLRRAGTDLDAADPVDDVGRIGEGAREEHAAWPRRPASGAGAGGIAGE